MKENEKIKEEKIYPAVVVKIIDPYNIVINRGNIHGISSGQRFLIYEEEKEETIDPMTGESLGLLEIIKGTGRVTHIQEKMSTIESDREEKIPARTITKGPFGMEKESIPPTSYKISFGEPKVGDKAKPI